MALRHDSAAKPFLQFGCEFGFAGDSLERAIQALAHLARQVLRAEQAEPAARLEILHVDAEFLGGGYLRELG